MSPKRSKADLERMLAEQVSHLRTSAAAFDAGAEHEAKRLATTLRILLHDKGQQKSLLGQLKALETLRFVDTAIYPNPAAIAQMTGLVILRMNTGTGAHYVPAGTAGELSPARQKPPRVFGAWWSPVLYKLPENRTLNRAKLVLLACEQEGGAHVDPRQNMDYRLLAIDNALSWFTRFPDGTQAPAAGDAALASVRQIASEVVATLEAAGLT